MTDSIEDPRPKDNTPVSNRGFVVDLMYNFPIDQNMVDKESYCNQMIQHLKEAFIEGFIHAVAPYNGIDSIDPDNHFNEWLKQPKKL